MSLIVDETKTYAHAIDDVYTAALGAVEGLEGKVVEKDREHYRFVATFHKKILGKVVGDRSHIEVTLTPVADGGQGTELAIHAYPLDAVGRKLLFGARKGVLRTVLNWFYAHLEHRLPKPVE